MRKRLKFLFVAPIAALAFLALSGSAMAGFLGGDRDPFEAGDPLTTNVPYVAWAGEEVRLVKCIEDERGFWSGQSAEWNIVTSSTRQPNGDPRDPVFFDDLDRRTGSFDGAGDQEGRTCWAIDVESVHPGMTRIKMAVDSNYEGSQPGSPILKHDFLVIWLNMSSPVLEELSNASFPGVEVGDPSGDGNFYPSDGAFKRGLIRATVTGSFVDINNNTRKLPDDWAALAGKYAVDTDSYSAPMRWDIHDDKLETEGHTSSSMCGGTSAIDAVDNCTGGYEVGSFSRLVGGTNFTLGPFDPVRPGSSFLPDGKLDAGDAPMPAARIDVELSGTVGALAPADKHVFYSRDRTGNSTDDPNTTPTVEGEHNLYAPFYAAFIPADVSLVGGDVLTTSGTHGTIANNFPGYQVGPLPGIVGVYHYWDLVNAKYRNRYNACKDVGGDNQVNRWLEMRHEDNLIQKPTGVYKATVYTDEHGEAMLEFLPDVGVTLTPDDQGLCDLGEGTAPQLLGSATISAEAMDPFQPTFNEVRASNDLVKNVYELASKSLDCYPKTPIEAVCIETITDIRGNPVQGAIVAFTADADKGDPNVIGLEREWKGYKGYDGQCDFEPADTAGLSEVSYCATNKDGQAAVVIAHTQAASNVDVLAENIGTRNGSFGILRDRCVRFAGDGVTLTTDGPTCANPTDGGAPAPAPAPAGNNNNNNTNNNSNNNSNKASNTASASSTPATVVSLAGSPVPAAKAPAAKPAAKAKAKALKLASARFVFKNGKRFLVVRANGTASIAKVRITLVMRSGKAMKPVLRTIRTNRPVRVANLQISKHVLRVRISLAK